MRKMWTLLSMAFVTGFIMGIALAHPCPDGLDTCDAQGINPITCLSVSTDSHCLTRQDAAGRDWCCCYDVTHYSGCPGGALCSISTLAQAKLECRCSTTVNDPNCVGP
jgi:hypothetical protein